MHSRDVCRQSARWNGDRAARSQIEAGGKPEHDVFSDRKRSSLRPLRRVPGQICAPRASVSAGRCRTWRTRCKFGCRYLEALEEGRIGELPGNAYALGFLRTYATALGLDTNEIARRFKAEAAAVNRKTELDFPDARAGARRAGRGGGAARRAAGGRRLCRLVSAVGRGTAAGRDHARRSRTPGAAGRAGSADRAPRQPLRPSRRAGRRPRRCSRPRSPPAPAISPSSAAAAPVPVPPVPATAQISRASCCAASADAWVQVRDRGGQVLLNRILHAGETWEVPAQAEPAADHR